MKHALLLSTAIALSTAAASAETLRIPHELGFGGAESMDPISPQRFYEAIQNVFSRLVRQGEDGRPSPDLAVEWSATPDAKEWTFKLREGVTFHNGNAFTAEDVAFSLMRTQSEVIDSPTKGVMGILDHVEVVDPLTAKVVLKQAHADFPLLVMDYRMKMVDAETCGNDLDALCESGIGTGPYKLTALDALGTTELERFEDYYGGTPGVEKMELLAIADQDARVAALQAGQLDFIYALSAEQKPLFEGNPNFTVREVATGRWVGMIMNTTIAPFDDARVRKAIRMTADREALGKLVYGPGGFVPTCDHPVWSGDQYRAEIDCPQDIEGAKALLAEAGYADGLSVELFVSDITEGAVRMAEVLQNQAAEAGIDIQIVQAPADGFWSDVWMKEAFFATGWSQRPADQILNEAFRSGAAWNESAWNDADFDAALDAARQELDFEKRKELYGNLQRRLFEEGGSFIPVHLNTVRAFSSKLSGIDPVEDFSIRYENVTKSE